MAENTTLIDLHLEMFWGSIVSTRIKCDSFIYRRTLSVTTSDVTGQDFSSKINDELTLFACNRGLHALRKC